MILKMLLGFAVSLTAVLVLMPHWINYLKKLSFNQNVSEYSLEEYKQKAKTPIMGGVMFIIVPVIVSVIFEAAGLSDLRMIVLYMTFVGYGLIGFTDDFLIVVKKNNDGLSPKMKFGMQLLLAVIFFFVYRNEATLEVVIPFTGATLGLGFGYAVLVLFMFTGASNAVNLTDGMDGLAAGCSVFSLTSFMIIAVLQKNTSLAVFIACLIGALFGYLYYNVKPAKIFMGDTGSLALGAVMAAIAMIEKKELAFIVIGGVFVIETLCVMIQIGSVKIRHKRVFPYTPIHYAFVLKGMTENKTVHMFWTCAACFSLLGLIIALF